MIAAMPVLIATISRIVSQDARKPLARKASQLRDGAGVTAACMGQF